MENKAEMANTFTKAINGIKNRFVHRNTKTIENRFNLAMMFGEVEKAKTVLATVLSFCAYWGIKVA